MKAWSAWEIVRRRVAVCGRVEDPQGNGIEGIEVSLVPIPELRPAAHSDLPVRTLTNGNGGYYFLDLPGGGYRLKAIDHRTGMQDQRDAAVSWDKGGKVVPARLNLKLCRMSPGLQDHRK
ncbi:MAG: carboxypeptidase-like regulatory domain-containing protein [Gammaproteobacteria bacterium]